MAATQKRWLTQTNSKLTKVDLAKALRKEAAWELLTPELRRELYGMLPPPLAGEAAHDIDVHPLKTRYRPFIEEELRRWQDDVRDGKEGKKWREDAMKAGQDRAAGKWDEWKEQQKQLEWGVKDENPRPNSEPSEEEVKHEKQ